MNTPQKYPDLPEPKIVPYGTIERKSYGQIAYEEYTLKLSGPQHFQENTCWSRIACSDCWEASAQAVIAAYQTQMESGWRLLERHEIPMEGDESFTNFNERWTSKYLIDCCTMKQGIPVRRRCLWVPVGKSEGPSRTRVKEVPATTDAGPVAEFYEKDKEPCCAPTGEVDVIISGMGDDKVHKFTIPPSDATGAAGPSSDPLEHIKWLEGKLNELEKENAHLSDIASQANLDCSILREEIRASELREKGLREVIQRCASPKHQTSDASVEELVTLRSENRAMRSLFDEMQNFKLTGWTRQAKLESFANFFERWTAKTDVIMSSLSTQQATQKP